MSPSPRPWASVVIPIKDERDNLTPLTERVLKVLSAREESNTAPHDLGTTSMGLYRHSHQG